MAKNGRVKFFDDVKGFGFIEQDDGGPDLYVNRCRVTGGGLLQNDRVTSEEDTSRGKTNAINVSGGTGGDLWGQQVDIAVRKYMRMAWPLHEALNESASEPIVLALLKQYPGAAKEKDQFDRLPLHHALESGNSEGVVMTILREYPDATGKKDSSDMLPLHHALYRSASDNIAKALLEHSPDSASVVDPENMLPLHIALESASSEKIALELLERYPVAAYKKDGDGRWPLQLALQSDASEIVVLEILKRSPIAAWMAVKTSPKDNKTELPLHLALEKNASGKVIFALLEASFARNLPQLAVRHVAAFLVDADTIRQSGLCHEFMNHAHNRVATSADHLYLSAEDEVLQNIVHQELVAQRDEEFLRLLAENEVVQEIVHQEPAAQRDEELLQHNADHAWAEAVESLIHAPSETSNIERGADADDAAPSKVHILRYGRGDMQRFRDALLEGVELRACRNAMSEHGFQCVLPSGALVFVQPNQYQDVVEELKNRDDGLCHFFIVISETLEHLIEDVLQKFSCRTRPRERTGSRQLIQKLSIDDGEAEISDAEDAAGSDGRLDIRVFLEVKRTFLCEAPFKREARTVAQSTTEAYCDESTISHYAYHRGYNPRRFA